MIKFKYIYCIVAFSLFATIVSAQTYNDSVRTNTWSIYIQGGVSGYHGARGDFFKGSEQLYSPMVGIGVKYNIRPWIRLGFNADFTTIKSLDKSILENKTITPNFKVGDYYTDLVVESKRIQNKNDLYLIGRDINVDFNVMQIWPNRGAQWFNIYLGVGVGWANLNNHNTVTWTYKEQAVASGSSYNNIFINNRMETTKNKNSLSAIYYPASISFEFDITRQFSAGVIGQYKFFPYESDNTPKGLYNAGITLRYNFVKSKVRLKSEEIANLKDVIEQLKNDCQADKEKLTKEANDKINTLNQKIAEKEREINEIKNSIKPSNDKNGAIVYFDNNSSILTKGNQVLLESIAKCLNDNPNQSAVLYASANSVGSTYSNQKLSDKRLEAVKEFLISNGVNPDQFKFELSLGEYKMDETEECRKVLIVVQ